MPKLQTSRDLPYASKDVFALIGDVPSYPEFLPWCAGARIVKGECKPFEGTEILAELMIRFKMFQESYISRVKFVPATKEGEPFVVDTVLEEGPFKHLSNYWVVTPTDAGCHVACDVDFAFQSKMLDKLIGGMFVEASKKMMEAFEERAHERLKG